MAYFVKLSIMMALIALALTNCLKKESEPVGSGLIIVEQTDPDTTSDPNTTPTHNPEPDSVIDTATQVQVDLEEQKVMGNWKINVISRAVMRVSPTDTTTRDSSMDVSTNANFIRLDTNMTYVSALSPLNVSLWRGMQISEAQFKACESLSADDSCTYLRDDTISVAGICRNNQDGIGYCQGRRTGGGQITEEAIAACKDLTDQAACTYDRNGRPANGTCFTNQDGTRYCRRTGGMGNTAAYDACNDKDVDAACSYTRGRRETSGVCILDTADVAICAAASTAEQLSQCEGKEPGAVCTVMMGPREREGACGMNIIGEFVCIMQRGGFNPRGGLQKVAATAVAADSGNWQFTEGILTLFSALPPEIPANATDSLKTFLATQRDTTVYIPNIDGVNITFTNTVTLERTRNNVVEKTTTHTVLSGQKQ